MHISRSSNSAGKRGERHQSTGKKDEFGEEINAVAKAAWFVSYLGCWRLLVPLHSHCDHTSRSPDPGDPPAPAYWPAGPMSLLRQTGMKSFGIPFVFITTITNDNHDINWIHFFNHKFLVHIFLFLKLYLTEIDSLDWLVLYSGTLAVCLAAPLVWCLTKQLCLHFPKLF